MNPEASQYPHGAPLVIAAGGRLLGGIQTCGDVRVRGTVHGDIVLGHGCVYVEPGGCVVGDVIADGIRVAGRLSGLCAADHVQIMPTGTVHGTAHAATLTIEQGGRLLGRSCLRALRAGFRFAVPQPSAGLPLARGPAVPPVHRAPGRALRRVVRLLARRWPRGQRCPAWLLLGLGVAGVGVVALLAPRPAVPVAARPVVEPATALPVRPPATVARGRSLAPPAIVARHVPALPVPAKPIAPPAPAPALPLPGTRPAQKTDPAAVGRAAPPAAAPTPLARPSAPVPVPAPVPAPPPPAVQAAAAPGELAWLESMATLQRDLLNHAIMQSTQMRNGVVGRQRSRAVAVQANRLMATRQLLKRLGGASSVAPYVFLPQGGAVASSPSTDVLRQRFETLRARASQLALHPESRELLEAVSGALADAGG